MLEAALSDCEQPVIAGTARMLIARITVAIIFFIFPILP
jgi:hypothetical protein